MVATAAGMSASSVSRIERGLIMNASVLDVARLNVAVGLDLSIRSYPGGQPVRDSAQLALLAAFRAAIHPSFGWRSEVPVGPPGDRRAWDAVIRARGTGRYGVEGETSPHDVQALERRLSLKRRDGDVDGVILVLPATRRVRAFLAAGADSLRSEFPADGARAMALLAAGKDPGGSAIVVIEGAFQRPSRRVGPGVRGSRSERLPPE